ncbi:Eukaryotic translation initiation factor 5B [Hondaea fermentalgiana]|uniref:Eukaryotic translation initiation factor 5B n=1 Tax=Hondaea fermentalgiana TaxID=2315210 RepID=A0A2R5GB57_9STRA|nr:Eukaryotic translation initiation factor 5B [Hondaea fermentalgiana]|eukprot:GBG26948.1 Eukaryotic translation initiation factor 5B [Hondaea fermentalgiana]
MGDAVDEEQAKILAALGLGGGGEGGGAKKKANKKKKKKGGGGGEQQQAGAKDGAPLSAAAKLARERLEQERLAREKAAEEEAERKRLEEEAERKRLEEERLEQERKDKKKQKDKERKERLRAEGKAVTKAEKAREAKAAAARQRLIDSGILKIDEDGNVIEPAKQKPVYGKRKNNKKQQQQQQQQQKEQQKEQQEEQQEEDAEDDEAEAPSPAAEAEVEAEAAEAVDADAKEDTADAADDDKATKEDEKEEEEEAEEDALLDNWDASDDDWENALDEQLDNKLQGDDDEVVEDEAEEIRKAAAAAPSAPTRVEGKKKNNKKKKKKGKKGGATKTTSKAYDSDDSDDDDDDDYSSDDDDNSKLTGAERVRLKEMEKEREIEAARERREERMREALKNRSPDDLRSPVCVVMGHVDTGKTKLLDKIRRTNVQEGEAGGITQQIGATYFPMDNLRNITERLNKDLSIDVKLPGLLVIDTPGHESFANLRHRGSSSANVAVLVVDIMHGLEQQTIESIKMLRAKRVPFVCAINKVDRCYGWQPLPGAPIRESLAQQPENVFSEFETRTQQVITQLMEQGLNAKLYYENKRFKQVVSLVPTSAHTGEGIPDLLMVLLTLTQRLMVEQLMFSPIMEATVLDVKKIEGVGTTVDVLLMNGKLRRGDTIVVAGMNGPIVTQIRALLTPQPAKEMRVKGEFVHHEELRAAMGVKIAAQNLEDAIAGTSMFLLTDDDDEDELKDAVMADVADIMGNVSVTGRGVSVQASTLGSLEALMEFLRTSDIPVASVQIGPVHKKDVSRASIMLEHEKEYACILAFDVKVTREAQEMAEDLGVRIFTADIIYHLFDHFTKYLEECKNERKTEIEADAVFPCVLKIIPEHVFMKRNPLVFGVEVESGIVKVGTPLVVPDKLIPDDANPGQTKMLSLGKIVSIEKDGAPVQTSGRGTKVAVKIQGTSAQSYVTFGRHFDHTNALVSKLTRKSIDLLKENFKNDLQRPDWELVIKLKKVFDIA